HFTHHCKVEITVVRIDFVKMLKIMLNPFLGIKKEVIMTHYLHLYNSSDDTLPTPNSLGGELKFQS
ncbi:MAG: hypothetical protein K6E54_01305, partial [Bacteroidaceae bacterium]|nr:hypothetical protein [Bacteroidaceae bacterium]